ncbi:hypothetical protein PRIPAC_78319 [Pristionchus pacificus]|uniref:Uncharacterized protein n=1 Tax=Pristionchus pacificus TaxID=54126 RepID=A0A2A6C4K1_PRIPA|nr:hypothetical protein PRIPAC_78319 [Pristionchus pacificus]|eukprot:PDM73037.1 hypothetical protein PRIPAC_39471 [Pristionchus pacificus]
MWGGCTRKKKYKPRSTTVNSIFAEVSEHKDPDADKVFECVKQLEKDEQLFSTYLFDDKNKGDLEVHILAHMNENLSDVFNCRLQSLKERDIAIVAVHAFYRSNKLNDEWSKCTFPLFTGLLVCYILRLMRRIFEGMHEWGLVELYKRSQDDFEDHVLELLDHAYRRNERKTRKALKINYHALIERQHSHSSACSVLSLLDLAMMAKCEKFLNHSMCRRISNERWTPRISISRIQFVFAFFTVIPIISIPFDRTTKYLTKKALEEQAQKRRASQIRIDKIVTNRVERVYSIYTIIEFIKRNGNNIKDFYSSPCSNFCIHTTFYFFYIFLYATVLLTRGKNEFQFSQNFFSIFYKEIVLFLWQLSFIGDMVYSSFTVGYKKFRASNPADSYHNFFNIAWMCLVLISTVLHEFKILPWMWGTLVVLWKFFFHVSFIFSSVRIMRVFAADSFFGAIVVMMKKMVYTLWSFLIVFLLFWSTYAIAVVSLLEEPPTMRTLAWSIFSNGAFEIFGEMKDEMQTGKVEGCPRMFNATTEIVDYTIDCFFRTWMLPILLFIYVLVSSVLLVNLVTSFFTNTFEQVRDSSMLHYRYKHYQRLVEFEMKLRTPAPFSLLYYICLLIVNSISFCFDPLFSLCRRSGKMSVTVDSAVLLKTEPGSPEDECAEIIKLIDMKSESQSVDSRINKSVNIVVDREDERQGKSWKRMSDKEKMVDIIGFIQKSMRSVQKTMELDREESIEEEEKQEKKSVVKKQKNTNKSNGVGSFFGYWRRTRTGKMKMIFTQLESTPFMITGKGKKFYVLEDIKKREKKRKSLRVVKFE